MYIPSHRQVKPNCGVFNDNFVMLYKFAPGLLLFIISVTSDDS